MSFWVGLKEYPGIKENKPKVDSVTNPKGLLFQKLTSSWKVIFNVPTLRIKDKVLEFRKNMLWI